MVDHPLVKQTIRVRWESPGAAAFEWHFLSDREKHARALDGSYDAIHSYNLAVVAPDIYFISWRKDEGDAISVVLNLDQMKAYGSYVMPQGSPVPMVGTVEKVGPDGS